MIRMVIGSAVAAVAMLILGFIFFVTPLGRIGIANLDDARAAAVQDALAVNLPRTATYSVPDDATAAQTTMYSRGPIATIHYNTGGFAADDPGVLIKGLIFNFLVALAIGVALIGIDRRVTDFGARARTAVIIALAAAGYTHLGEPIYLHHDWPHFIYLFVADGLALAAAGLIIAWFLPRPAVDAVPPADAPTEV